MANRRAGPLPNLDRELQECAHMPSRPHPGGDDHQPPTPSSGPILADLLKRAGDPHAYARWERQVRHARYCTRPVRLRGAVDQADTASGEVRTTFDTSSEPDGVLLKACGTRRAARCQPCAEVYQADAYQLVKAGVAGGKGVPETVASHPRVFATFTAPSFGRVHIRRERGGSLYPCHAARLGEHCPHGRRLACWHKHDQGDVSLGTPLCPECYDYTAAVVWNALALILWRRTTIYFRRALARLLGCTTVELLSAAIRHAATSVWVLCPAGLELGPVGWGDQLDLRPITAGTLGEGTEVHVAGYLAKYATKATEGLAGVALERPIRRATELTRLMLPAHIRRMVETAWRLGARPELTNLRLRAWAHQLGYGGHCTTKSRRYSTTFTSLRRARQDYERRRAFGGEPLDAWGRPEVERAAVVVASWSYAGRGYTTLGDAWLARSMLHNHQEERRIAREELTAVA